MNTALLVEDEFLIRELAEAYLSDVGFEVISARSAQEALDVLQGGEKFDLLFTDIRMPGEIDGREIAKRAKAQIEGLRVIYATGYSDFDDPLGEREALIGKPYNMTALLRVLDDLGFPAP